MRLPVSRPGPRYEALLELLRVAEALWEASRAFFARWGLSPSQFNVLNLLRAAPDELSQNDLGRALIMHRSNVTGLVDRLEVRGLVARKERAAARRAWRVVLTPRGGGLLHQVLPPYYRVAEKVWGDLLLTRTRGLVAELRGLACHAEQMVAAHEEAHERPT